MKKANYTPVAKHFATATPVSVSGLDYDPCPDRPPYRSPIRRLAFARMSPKDDVTVAQLCHTLEKSSQPSDVLFFDTGAITKTMPTAFWRSAATRKLAFPQAVVDELSGWAKDPFFNQCLHPWLPRAFATCAGKPLLPNHHFRVTETLAFIDRRATKLHVGVADRASLLPFGYEHYVKLLSIRKRYGLLLVRELQAAGKKDVTENDIKQLLNNRGEARNAALAAKGWRDFGKPNYLADEELVVTAVMTAILTGMETVIFTWDNDVLEQFVKLLELLLAEYYCWCFGEYLHRFPDRLNLATLRLRPEETGPGSFVRGQEVRHVGFIEGEEEKLLPPAFNFVNVYCYLLGNSWQELKFSSAACCLEQEMRWLLEAKAATGGKNTPHFGAKNVMIGSRPETSGVTTFFFLAEEQEEQFEGLTVTVDERTAVLKADTLVAMKHFRDSREGNGTRTGGLLLPPGY